MKLCQTCDQLLAEEMSTCPSCGAGVDEGKRQVNGYRILEVLREGHASILCKAVKTDDDTPVMIRLFKSEARVDAVVAARLKNRLRQLDHLPENGFVKHYDIQRSEDDQWYCVSEWIESDNWSRILASDTLKDPAVFLDFFHKIAYHLEILHKTGHFIPHLVLSDLIVFRKDDGTLDVKIDYKLSTFLHHTIALPGTMLSNLLSCHPDIANNQPLDFKSDIWSLGKIFVECLTADLDECPSTLALGELPIPEEMKILLKTMLADDRELRPRSMKEVTETLDQLRKAKRYHQRKSLFARDRVSHNAQKKPRIFTKVLPLIILVVLVLLFGMSSWIYVTVFRKNPDTVFQKYANTYSKSIAFVLVEYSLTSENQIVYSNRVEGTAFLVDETGYLLTNRHVVCPWLKDPRFYQAINQMNLYEADIQFSHRIYLWFEGQKAYRRLPDLADSVDLNDIYHIESAYRSDGKPRVYIAGVARPLNSMAYRVHSPLQDDFAFLRIDVVPEGLKPLPLDKSLKPLDIPKLSPIISIGFPLGSQSQNDNVNVSVTKGSVRRVFQGVIQVDTSIYKGNSGGPIVDIDGQVIGIATAVAFTQATSMIPVLTPLSDIGLVLPITKPGPFLDELKAGQAKWKGIPDLSLEKKIKNIRRNALEGKWLEARDLATLYLRFSLEPEFYTAAGMISFCVGDYQNARRFFQQSLSVDSNNGEVKLTLFLLDWLEDNATDSPYGRELTALDWRSNLEFYGYLSKILTGDITAETALRGWYSESEKSWVNYILGMIARKQGKRSASETLFSKVTQSASKEDWVLVLALSELSHIHNQKLVLAGSDDEKKARQSQFDELRHNIFSESEKRKQRAEKLLPLLYRLLNPALITADKIEIMTRIREIDRENKDYLVGLAFYNLIEERWDEALRHIDEFLAHGGRQNRAYLSLEITRLGILNKTLGEKKQMKPMLKDLHNRIDDRWYKAIINMILLDTPQQNILDNAELRPEELITARCALGFWAEGNGAPEEAIRHYKEALSSYLDDWWEYQFASKRIRLLKQSLINSAR